MAIYCACVYYLQSDEASTRSDISDPSSSSDSDVFNQPRQHETNSDMLSGREVVSGYEHPVVIQEKVFEFLCLNTTMGLTFGTQPLPTDVNIVCTP